MVPLKSIGDLGILELFLEEMLDFGGIIVFFWCLTPNRWREFTIDPESMYNKRICFFGRDDDESDSRELFGTVAVVL